MIGLADLIPDNLGNDELAGLCRRLQSSALIDKCVNPDDVRRALNSGTRQERINALWKLKGAVRAKQHETRCNINAVRDRAHSREQPIKARRPKGAGVPPARRAYLAARSQRDRSEGRKRNGLIVGHGRH